ncbi:MAG: hypothetical protein ACOX54_10750 [Christensenellales bacterium]|jgi:predicted HTH domain antitoxin
MDKRTENRYKKVKRDQKKLEEKIAKENEELKLLKMEEEELVGQVIVSLCEDKHLNLFEAVERLHKSNNMTRRENYREQKEREISNNENKENL